MPIAFNVVPLNYRIVEDGYTEEEIKLRDESRKILEIPDLAGVGHLRARAGVHRPFAVDQRRVRAADPAPTRRSSCCAQAPGVVVTDVPNPLEATGRDPVFVGRVRRDPTVEHGLALFVTATTCAKAQRSTRCRSPKSYRRGGSRAPQSRACTASPTDPICDAWMRTFS